MSVLGVLLTVAIVSSNAAAAPANPIYCDAVDEASSISDPCVYGWAPDDSPAYLAQLQTYYLQPPHGLEAEHWSAP